MEEGVPKSITESVKAKKSVQKAKGEDELTAKSETKTTATKKVSGVKDKPKKAKDSKPVEASDDVDGEGNLEDGEDEGSDIDDQTDALLTGFESEGDEEQDLKEGGLQEGQVVPRIPTLTNKNKKNIDRVAKSQESEKPAVVYVGRIPHGFYENEMREYFKQFGEILKLRLSRNPKTGNSRHFAFIQFASHTVADIVARTMDNYLLFDHILKVKLVPDEQVHETLFKGANKRFKKVPWNKIRGRQLEQGASEAVWAGRIEKEAKRRKGKAEKMKAIGYEFEAPKIKSAKNVAKKGVEQPAITENGKEEIKAIKAAPAAEELSKSKKKKEKKAKAPEDTAMDVPSSPVVTEEPEKPKKVKKSKALKETETIENALAPAVEVPSEVKPKKSKKQNFQGRPVSRPLLLTEASEKLKAKKSKAALVDNAAVGEEQSEVKVKKPKKSKKAET